MNNRMKRFAAVACAGVLAVMMTACGQSEQAPVQVEETKAETVEVTAETEAAAETEAVATDSEPIQIATKPITEQYILGELLKVVIEENTPYTVEITKGIGGGTSNIMPAMEKGEFDLYPEYTSSGYVLVLEHDPEGVSDEEMWSQLRSEYAEQFDMSWVGEYGFNNTYAVVMRADDAAQNSLVTVSDLVNVASEKIFGGNPDYLERADGFPKVCETYGLDFKNVKDIDIGLKYEALRNMDIDVTNGYTTDAQLGTGEFVALEDDLHLQLNYFCSTVVRNDTLESHPGLEEAILLMNNCLSDTEMARLNAEVEINGKDEASVARAFAVEKGLIAE